MKGDLPMTIRQRQEAEEQARLSPYAALASESAGRAHPISSCDLRTCYQRDRDRIIHCKSFRRLKYKTQVFLSPMGDHYRTRLTHTLEVSQVARTLARCLRLNEDLTEAIALGHDLGHTPFGHIGETTLNNLLPGGFRHNIQSLRVAERLENGGKGLNLCLETLDGIRNHSGEDEPKTLEGWCVRRADRIAYINHDIDDAIRAGILTVDDLPAVVRERIGDRHSIRINSILADLIENSTDGVLKMSPPMQEAVDTFHSFMYEAVYRNPKAKSEEAKVNGILHGIWEYYFKNPDKLPADFAAIAEEEGLERAVCDYISGMTDKYAMYQYSEIFIPAAWQVR